MPVWSAGAESRVSVQTTQRTRGDHRLAVGAAVIIATERLGELTLKGLSQPLACHRLLQLRER
jgi:hypothetical protein